MYAFSRKENAHVDLSHSCLHCILGKRELCRGIESSPVQNLWLYARILTPLQLPRCSKYRTSLTIVSNGHSWSLDNLVNFRHVLGEILCKAKTEMTLTWTGTPWNESLRGVVTRKWTMHLYPLRASCYLP